MLPKTYQKILFVILLLLIGFISHLFYKQILKISQKSVPNPPTQTSKGKVKYPEDYLIVAVGDSMTETLGNFDELKKFLSDFYPKKTFEVLNYGYGATNILSVMDRVTHETEHGRKFRPISEIDYDLILLESFGENPLSQFPQEMGLKLQSEELEKIVNKLKETNPKGQIVFVVTISPNKKIFAQNQVDLAPEKRIEWVNERIAYIKNHIAFAQAKFIPVINIFEKSLLENGDGNPDYISNQDYIHPSPTGIIFIQKTMADFIYNNHLLK